jgi:hypothetical protein
MGHRSPEADAAERNFEAAIIGLREAQDSRGLRIFLYRGSSYTSAGFRDALREITSAPFSADRVVFFENKPGAGELTFARHLQLLTNCYVAALEYEQAAGLYRSSC